VSEVVLVVLPEYVLDFSEICAEGITAGTPTTGGGMACGTTLGVGFTAG